LNNLQRGYLTIGAAFFNSLWLIKSGPDAFVGFITFRTSSTSFSHTIQANGKEQIKRLFLRIINKTT
jgi:hypothetical protein